MCSFNTNEKILKQNANRLPTISLSINIPKTVGTVFIDAQRYDLFLKQTIDKNARLHKYAEIKMNVIKYCIHLNETNSVKKAF